MIGFTQKKKTSAAAAATTTTTIRRTRTRTRTTKPTPTTTTQPTKTKPNQQPSARPRHAFQRLSGCACAPCLPRRCNPSKLDPTSHGSPPCPCQVQANNYHIGYIYIFCEYIYILYYIISLCHITMYFLLWYYVVPGSSRLFPEFRNLRQSPPSIATWFHHISSPDIPREVSPFIQLLWLFLKLGMPQKHPKPPRFPV